MVGSIVLSVDAPSFVAVGSMVFGVDRMIVKKEHCWGIQESVFGQGSGFGHEQIRAAAGAHRQTLNAVVNLCRCH